MVAKANRSTFDRAIAHVLKWEGANSFDRNGGKIRFGIHQANHPSIDVAKLTLDDAIDVHRSCYWDGIRAEELPIGVATMVFDCAVSMGAANAIRILQSAVGVAQSGVMDTQTIVAACNANQTEIVNWYAVTRIMRYSMIDGFADYGSVMVARTIECAMMCYEMLFSDHV